MVNPFEYGYKKGSSVTIPAEVFMGLMDFGIAVVRKETQELIEVMSVKEGEMPKEDEVQDNIVRVMVSPLGKRGESLVNALVEIHTENIDKKFAVKQTPELDLGETK